MIRAKNTKLAYVSEQDGNASVGNMVDLFGTSADPKPTEGIVNGSTFQEVDTGDFYFFNETTSTWVKKNESGGGGGGDYSTATITVIGGDIPIEGPFQGSVEFPGEGEKIVSCGTNALGMTFFTTIILYQGQAIISTLDGDYQTFSGNITRLAESIYLVTGDCSITHDK